jgi:hypothetical protein
MRIWTVAIVGALAVAVTIPAVAQKTYTPDLPRSHTSKTYTPKSYGRKLVTA